MNVLWNHISPILTLLVFHCLQHEMQSCFQVLVQGADGFSAWEGAWGKLKFCTFCTTELTAQTDSQGMQGKISLEDFLGIE